MPLQHQCYNISCNFMKLSPIAISIIATLWSCAGKTEGGEPGSGIIPLIGTWQLITGMVIQKGDTVMTDYTKNTSFIKIINKTHFAFLQHDLHKGKDSADAFVSGGGRYSLTGGLYTESLEYCSARNWEGTDFRFTINIKNDTLIQSGMETVESAGVNRRNIETYVRVK